MPALEAPALAPEHASTIARFAKAIGLALGLAPKSPGLNLRKGPLAFERGFAWVKERVPLLAGLAAVILVSFLFSAWAQLYAKSKERAILEKALATVTKEVLGEETSAATRANELLAAQTSINDEDPLPHADAFDVMVKLSEVIPTSMTHDIEELDIQKQHVIVHGIVGTIPDAQAIRSSIANERCFSDAKITRTNAQVGGTSQKYVLEFDIKCPEDQKGGGKAKPSSSAAASASAPAAGGSK
jgi:general secretion pathway protein L